MNINMLGIDIAKNIFQLHGIDKSGKPVLKKRLIRSKLLGFIKDINPGCIVMEACGGANYWSREFQKMGYTVKLISPQYVKPFVKSNKHDAADAQAICEAASRPSMLFVAPKSIEQQDIQSIHRIRERLISHRTRLANQTRGLLTEYGIVIPKGIWHLRRQLPTILEDASNELTVEGRMLFAELYEELCEMDKKIKVYDEKLETIFNQSAVCQRLAAIEGFGVIGTTALVAAIGDVHVFKNGRQMSAWLGLTPREHSSGGKQVLLGISKRGDKYLRKVLIQGAGAVVYRAKHKKDKRSQWINALVERRGKNKTRVAVVNKNIRIAWSLLANDTNYKKAA